MNIYVGNLSLEVTEADLHDAFSGFWRSCLGKGNNRSVQR